jgi:hypothetical protein
MFGPWTASDAVTRLGRRLCPPGEKSVNGGDMSKRPKAIECGACTESSVDQGYLFPLSPALFGVVGNREESKIQTTSGDGLRRGVVRASNGAVDGGQGT